MQKASYNSLPYVTLPKVLGMPVLHEKVQKHFSAEKKLSENKKNNILMPSQPEWYHCRHAVKDLRLTLFQCKTHGDGTRGKLEQSKKSQKQIQIAFLQICQNLFSF